MGGVFPLLAAVGLVWAIVTRRAHVTVAFLLAIVVQAVTLWFMSSSIGAETSYMAYKMGSLAVYPLAIFGSLALHAVVSRTALPVQTAIGWMMATVMVIATVRPALNAPHQVPVVSLDLYDAGRWLCANVGAGCADYLVGSADTAYWLHLAVLGNPRAEVRTAEIDRFDSRQVIGEWVASGGRGDAVADLRLLPDEVRRNVQVIKKFGQAAGVRRPGGTINGCDFR